MTKFNQGLGHIIYNTIRADFSISTVIEEKSNKYSKTTEELIKFISTTTNNNTLKQAIDYSLDANIRLSGANYAMNKKRTLEVLGKSLISKYNHINDLKTSLKTNKNQKSYNNHINSYLNNQHEELHYLFNKLIVEHVASGISTGDLQEEFYNSSNKFVELPKYYKAQIERNASINRLNELKAKNRFYGAKRQVM